ncbi:5-adenylylsulfate reductase-like 4 [Striga hermonthica]|uniref:5-adenylylsulfate reductase-like 4 n=1 Tax=Striga hermonthica TaxID=68872 RepID=A0A9N7NWC0_STRHE|nr:5-adenylylsulfate reductase-like 4 [Striga hermonthica]
MAAAFGAGLVLLLLVGRLTCADSVRVSKPPAICPLNSVQEAFFPSQNHVCSVFGAKSDNTAGVIEGDEVSLQKALDIVHKNKHDYVSLLFYSSWCPFSGSFRPSFSLLSSIFPSIPHFAIEESAVRPSILSKYGVHGFPTLVLLNSTMRMRYQGSRTLDSLISFYNAVTGIKMSADGESIGKIVCSGNDEKHGNNLETCPFPWARSPENLFKQETYLTLATLFVILRLLQFFFPTLRRWAQLAWRSFLERPCKQSNLREGAENAKAWASKSLATVSFGDSSSNCDA